MGFLNLSEASKGDGEGLKKLTMLAGTPSDYEVLCVSCGARGCGLPAWD